MDFNHAVKIINNLLIEKRPESFNSSWVLKHAPHVYRFIQKNVRADVGGIDWDRFTRAIDRKFQRKWKHPFCIRKKLYRKKGEVDIILQKYHSRLYVFISPMDKSDEYIRDIICISLVRVAQKGNILAREEINKLVRLTIDEWIESRPTLSSWQGHESAIPLCIEACIRRYRYSGTFMGYLLKTFEYSGRGLILTRDYQD
jgi:hypothetical protein